MGRQEQARLALLRMGGMLMGTRGLNGVVIDGAITQDEEN